MRGQLFSLVVGVVALAAAAFGRQTPQDPADTFAYRSVPLISSIDFADLAKRSPVCDCDTGKKCPCADCLCNTVPQEPLKVGLPPDLVSIANGAIKSEQVQHRFTSPNEPPPGLIVPVASTVKKIMTVQPASTGHWETRYAGIRGRRSYQVWVSHQPLTASSECTSGACSTGYGSAPMRYGGACRSCR